MAGQSFAERGVNEQERPQDIAKLMGIPTDHPLAEVANIEGQIAGEIGFIAQRTMDEEHSDIRTIDGVDYLVSKGNEHFSIYQDTSSAPIGNSQTFGFRLMRRKVKKNQYAVPIILVSDGNVNNPYATIRPQQNTVNLAGEIHPTDDKRQMTGILSIVRDIAMDSKERAEEERLKEKREQYHSRRKLKRRLGTVATAAALAAVAGGFVFGIHQASERSQEEQIQQQAAAEQLREQREQEVREFDALNTIEGVESVTADTAGLAPSSSQFVDVDVPRYAQNNISSDISRDISHPRAIDATELSDTNNLEVAMEVNVGDEFRVIHNGHQDRLYIYEFDAASDSMRIRDIGTLDPDIEVPPATEFIIQRVEQSTGS